MMSETAEVQTSKREQSKAANRAAILVAARRVFAEIGYEAATVRDIIRRTDLASGTFYNYFRSKEEVFEAIADDGARRFRPLLRAARANAADFEAYLRSALRAYFQFLDEENPEAGRPTHERRPHVRADTPQIAAVFDEVRESLLAEINRGALPSIDASFLAAACIGVAQEVGEVMLARAPRDIEDAAQFAAAMILKGMAGAPRRAR